MNNYKMILHYFGVLFYYRPWNVQVHLRNEPYCSVQETNRSVQETNRTVQKAYRTVQEPYRTVQKAYRNVQKAYHTVQSVQDNLYASLAPKSIQYRADYHVTLIYFVTKP
jgi:hypothetical protein